LATNFGVSEQSVYSVAHLLIQFQ